MPRLAPTDIDGVAGQTDPVARNRAITQSYHELSLTIRERTGPVANWCAFAAWASRQAGDTIRGDDARRLLARTIDDVGAGAAADGVVTTLHGLGARPEVVEIRRTLRGVFDVGAVAAKAADAVARGNRKVFAEIGRHFAEFIESRLDDTTPDDAALARFIDSLRPGDPPDGQQLLRLAFAHLYAALFETDRIRRIELVLLSDLEIGLHEQTRLQPEIAEALNVAVPDAREIGDRLMKGLFPWGGWVARFRIGLRRLLGGKTPLDRALEHFVNEVRSKLRHALTEHVMTLELANGERLRLGQDHVGTFPPETANPQLPELITLIARIDPTPDSARASGATDWADFDERMHFIADLFRARALDVGLFQRPGA